MQDLFDFLSFRSFISPYVLIVFYYMGAIVIPLGSWFFALWIKRKYNLVSDAYESGKSILLSLTRKKNRIWFAVLFFLLFIFMEIMWRMMFEFLLAYLQIRDALLLLTPT